MSETDLPEQHDAAPVAEVIPLARPITPPGPRDVTGWDLVAAVVIIWACDLGLGFAAGFVTGFAAGATGETTTPVHPLLLLGTALASTACMVVVCWYFVCRKYGRSLCDGFAIRPIRAKSAIGCLALGLLGALLGFVLLTWAEPGDSPMAELSESPFGVLVIAVMGLLVPPFEEMYYRGLLYPVLRRRFGSAVSVAVVTVWFALAHLQQLFGDWVGLGLVFTMGAIWTLQRHLSGSLIPSIITHWTYNACLILVLPLLIGLLTTLLMD